MKQITSLVAAFVLSFSQSYKTFHLGLYYKLVVHDESVNFEFRSITATQLYIQHFFNYTAIISSLVQFCGEFLASKKATTH